MRINIQRNTTDETPSDKELHNWVALTVHTFARPKSTRDVSIILLDCDAMLELNYHYRQVNQATDVLAFPNDNYRVAKVWGDIALCPVIIAQAIQRYKVEWLHHWSRLLVHGTLHLLGYDHHTLADERIMQDCEWHMMRQLNHQDYIEQWMRLEQ